MLEILHKAFAELHKQGGKPLARLQVEDKTILTLQYQGIATYHANSEIPYKNNRDHPLTSEKRRFTVDWHANES